MIYLCFNYYFTKERFMYKALLEEELPCKVPEGYVWVRGGGFFGGSFELKRGDLKVGCVIELMNSGGFYWAGFGSQLEEIDYNPLVKTGNLLEVSQAVVDLVSGGKNMFPFKKKVVPVQEKEDPPKFKRGDKVRDIYGGPVVYVDKPMIMWGNGPRIKCCWWTDGEIKYVYYEEDEIVSFEW